MLLSEVFPFKSRAYAIGLVAGINFILAFIGSKSYYNLEVAISLAGVTCVYGVFGIVGLLVAIFFLPETENRAMEDIELYFADKTRKMADIYIPIRSSLRQR